MAFLSENRRALNLGSCIYGIPVTLHFSFFLLLFVEMILSISLKDAYWTSFIFFLYGPILLITIIVHELGHIVATLKLGGVVGGIVLWPLGGFALCGPTDKGAKGDFLVAIAGPLTHPFQSMIWFALYFVTGRGISDFKFSIYLKTINSSAGGYFSTLCAQAIWLNLMLFCFNLLIPAYPLDGGRCLASLLVMFGVELNQAAYTTAITSMVIGAIIGLYALCIILLAKNFGGIFLALIAAYVFFEGKKLFDLTKAGKVKDHPVFGRDCYDNRESTDNDAATVATDCDEQQHESAVV
mmetsp:Transcript_17656/g.17088  ORF Transcript_17656/g.17088 Transcript_17656/m.17088 type:complete len:296 (-) Transcript_17656:252-1139(-)